MRSLISVLRNPGRRLRGTLTALLAGSVLAGCTDLDVTNPNQPSSGSFWRTEADAERALTAAYNGLLLLGTYGRWQAFAHDIRSDIGTAQLSPWGDLANFNRFVLNNYNFEINDHLWRHNYHAINRANLVIANVPGMSLDPARENRIVAEAKFLRALLYYNLVILYENIPLITRPLGPQERPGNAPPAETWAQIEQDLTDAAAVLPESYGTGDVGRATKGAALALLGKARLQQRKWAAASEALAQVINSGQYSLMPDYADNFTSTSENNAESVFEVQMGDETTLAFGIPGLSFPKMIGPCYRPPPPHRNYNPTFCDGRPTRWYFEQFQKSRTITGAVDPRLDVTILYSLPGSDEMIYGEPRQFYFRDVPESPDVREDTILYFRKYGEHHIPEPQRWDNPINYRVIRYADVLLMQAEALLMQGQAAAALPLINQVRARVDLPPLVLVTIEAILQERLLEFGLEGQRFADLLRHDLLSPALVSHDPDFANFVVGKSERLPIPTSEINLNPNIQQNPGW